MSYVIESFYEVDQRGGIAVPIYPDCGTRKNPAFQYRILIKLCFKATLKNKINIHTEPRTSRKRIGTPIEIYLQLCPKVKILY